MENVALGNFFCGKIANKKSRAHGELIPLAFSNKFSFLLQKFFISPIHFGRPSLILIIRRCTALGLLLSLARCIGAGKVAVLRIQGLERCTASLLDIGWSLTVWMMGSDIIVRVIIGVRSGLFLGGRSSRQIGSSRGQ